jgi:formate-dependent nitrite reductase cytochrome c552 subunit
MKRVATACLILVAFLLLVAMAFTASAQVVNLKIEAIWPTKFGTGAQKPAASTLPVSSGLSVVPIGMKVYFAADTTGSGASIVSSFSWSIALRPNGSTANFAQTSTIKDTLIPDIEGLYIIQLVSGGKTMSQTITASKYKGSTTATDCGLCHAVVPKAQAAWSQWRTSDHATMLKQGLSGMLEIEPNPTRGDSVGSYGANCVKCHTTGWDQTANNGNFGYLAHKANGATPAWDTTWIKNASVTGSYIKTNDTTNWSQLNTTYPNLVATATIGCEDCHGPANYHSTTGSKLGVSRSSDACMQCHAANFPGGHHALGSYWLTSVHAQLPNGSHTAQTGCYPCHSGSAFVTWVKANKSSNAPYDTTTIGGQPSPSNDGNVPIGCPTCHDPHTMDLRTTTFDTLRNGYRVPANIGGKGKLCMNCHNSRYSVTTRVTNKAPYYGFSDRFGPHHNPQADMYYGSNAYQYGDTTITGLMTHGSLADACVTCHMAPGANPGNLTQAGHTWAMVDSAGNPTVSGLLACQPCHGTITKYSDIKASADYDGNGKIEGFQTELEGLLTRLKNKLPKDSTGEVISMLADSLKIKGNQKLVGDIYNYWFVTESRCIGVHNPKYAVAILQKALGITFTGIKALGPIPTTFALSQNYPNPFNPTTNIEFAIPQHETVKLEVYDILGRLVTTLANTDMPAGTYKVIWNGKDSNGQSVATGLYLYRLQAGSFTSVKKMLMLK